MMFFSTKTFCEFLFIFYDDAERMASEFPLTCGIVGVLSWLDNDIGDFKVIRT